MHKLLFVLFVLVQSFNSDAQIDEIRRITKQLCSPEFHGRGYVNKGDSLAADYLVNEFKKLGLDPYKGDYLQHFTILGVNTFPNQMSVSQNGQELQPGEDFVVDPSSAGFEGELNPMIISGSDFFDETILQNVLEEVLYNEKYNAIALDLASLSDDSLKEMRGISQAFAEIIPVIEITKEQFTWSVGRTQLKNVLLQVQADAYNGESLNVRVESQFISNYQSHNVMAFIPAKKKCKATIMFTAHYDHLGRMGSETNFPGENDNAVGSAMLITMSKYFKSNPCEQQIIFVAYAGE